jgi:flavin reductase (DIM6/NTAB) family NADH-FMN oxidoreductase RutF
MLLRKTVMQDMQHIAEPGCPDPGQLISVHPLSGSSTIVSPELRRSYRDALGRFATGVTVITVATDDGPVGMTVNSFASVSLDPALVLWSINRTSARHDVFREADHFAIHVLAQEQQQLAVDFARDAQAFRDEDWVIGEECLPLATRALARFECAREVVHDGGDHSIIIGRVLRFSHRPGQPLIFASGRFDTIAGLVDDAQ